MANREFSKKIYKKLPKILSDVTNLYEGRNRDVILLSSITVLSTSFPKIKAYYDDDVFYPNLYSMIVAPPASGKGIMMKSKKLIEAVDKYVKEKILTTLFSEYVSDEEMMDTASEDKDDKKKEKFKPPVLTVIPANTSSTELIRYMNSNENGVLMIESEMDTMGNVIRNDWGNYSDLLRKAFQHEAISESRKKDQQYVHIEEPKLSVLLSGTPDQVKGIANSRENGLLSRFLIYAYDEITPFKNVFSREPDKKNKVFTQQGLKVLSIFKALENLENEIEFRLSEQQEVRFLRFFASYQETIVSHEPLSFISNLRRLALIVFRMCMVLTVCRHEEEIAKMQTVECSNRDFLIALSMMEVLIEHSLFNFKSFASNGLSELDIELLDSFDSGTDFGRMEFVEAGTALGFSERTLADKLNLWARYKIIKRIKHGIYRKK